MNKLTITTLALCLTQAGSAFASPTPTGFQVPAECKNLAIMQGQLIGTRFHNGIMGDGTYNPAELTLKSNNGFQIGTVEYLGGDSEDQSGPNAGKYPCDLDQNLCNSPADAGGAIDWARVTVNSNGAPSAQVVVSMGSRGGCSISSSRNLVQ